jgi:hypothetical protein
VLDHPDRQLREFFDLVKDGLSNRIVFLFTENVPAATAHRPMLDYFIDRARRQQIPTVTLVPRLPAMPTARRTLAPLRRAGGRIRARRSRGIPRATVQPPLKLGDPLILTRNASFKPTDLLIHPQQHRHHGLTALVIDRLRLQALHTHKFDEAELCPPTPTERLQKIPHLRGFSEMGDTGLEPRRGARGG